jgi:NTE family protein
MADKSSNDQQKNEKPYVIVALQGGGALGAFQAGAYKALSENQYEPDWVAGISIGAINASIMAGNPQNDRLPRLLKFWDVLERNRVWWESFPNYSEKLTNV